MAEDKETERVRERSGTCLDIEGYRGSLAPCWEVYTILCACATTAADKLGSHRDCANTRAV